MSALLTGKLRAVLAPELQGKTLYVCIGNTLRADDAVGPYIATLIHRPPGNVIVLDAGDKPENIIDQAVAVNPVKTILIDAADFKGSPGEIALIPQDSIPHASLTTHTFPLPIISKILAEDTGSVVYYVGIQIASIQLGGEICSAVKAAAQEIAGYIMSGSESYTVE